MWKDLLKELESLTEASGRNAHRVATIARQFLKDKKWIDDVHGGKRDDAERELARFSKRMALSLDSLLCMIDFFPKVEDWDGADLDDLRWKAICLQNDRQKARRAAQRPASTPRDKEDLPVENLQRIVAELDDHHRTEIKQVKQKQKEQEKELETASETIARLHRTIAEIQAKHAGERKQWKARETELMEKIRILEGEVARSKRAVAKSRR